MCQWLLRCESIISAAYPIKKAIDLGKTLHVSYKNLLDFTVNTKGENQSCTIC